MYRNKEWMDILGNLTEELKSVYKDSLKEVILYGSVARGTADENSDIDILLLIDLSPEEMKRYEAKLCDISTNYALEYFKVFSIMDVSYNEYEEWKEVSPFYKNVSTEGVKIYAA